MEKFLDGKRIFEQNQERILTLDSSKISKHVYLEPYVAIKKGDLFAPSKWIDFENKSPESSIIPLEKFNLNDYEYISDFSVYEARKLRTLMGLPLLSTRELDYESIFKLDSIPEHLEMGLREILEYDSFVTKENLEFFLSDVYISDNNVILLDFDGIHNIDQELTSKFENKQLEIMKTAYRNGKKITLVKFSDPSDKYDFQGDWYVYHAAEFGDYHILTKITDVEDLLPFTDFK